jgi:hypothetical protein
VLVGFVVSPGRGDRRNGQCLIGFDVLAGSSQKRAKENIRPPSYPASPFDCYSLDSIYCLCWFSCCMISIALIPQVFVQEHPSY